MMIVIITMKRLIMIIMTIIMVYVSGRAGIR